MPMIAPVLNPVDAAGLAEAGVAITGLGLPVVTSTAGLKIEARLCPIEFIYCNGVSEVPEEELSAGAGTFDEP